MDVFELTFLGTCACDFSPALQGEYQDKFGLDARRSSSVLINGKYLVDCGPHTVDSLRIAGVAIEKITDLFITHFHSDHFHLENIQSLAKAKKTPLRVWVREDAPVNLTGNIEVVYTKRHQKYALGDEVFMSAVYANHDESSYPQWFYFERGETNLLYAVDGAWFLTESYRFLKNRKLSLLILDATSGDYTGDYRMAEHNSIPMIRLMLPSLEKYGIVDKNTQVWLQHLAPSLHLPHKQTEDLLKKDGLRVCYDGLVLKI